MLNYTITSIPVYINRAPRHVVLYNEYNNLNAKYHTYLEEHADRLEKIKDAHNTLEQAVADLIAGTVPNNSVSTVKLVDNSVTTAKIKNNAVTNDKLAGNIHSSKLKHPSALDLYRYLALTGYASDMYYKFEPISCTIKNKYFTRHNGDTYARNYINISCECNIPLPDDIVDCLICKYAFNACVQEDAVDPDIGITFLHKMQTYEQPTLRRFAYGVTKFLSIKIGIGDYELNTETNNTFSFHKVSDGTVWHTVPNDELETAVVRVKFFEEDDKNYLNFAFNFTINCGYQKLTNLSDFSGYYTSTPDDSVITDVNVMLNSYPILPLY